MSFVSEPLEKEAEKKKKPQLPATVNTAGMEKKKQKKNGCCGAVAERHREGYSHHAPVFVPTVCRKKERNPMSGSENTWKKRGEGPD